MKNTLGLVLEELLAKIEKIKEGELAHLYKDDMLFYTICYDCVKAELKRREFYEREGDF